MAKVGERAVGIDSEIEQGLDEYSLPVTQINAIPVDSMHAAHSHYRQSPHHIDARIEANAAAHF
jgi:hypothetical protein